MHPAVKRRTARSWLSLVTAAVVLASTALSGLFVGQPQEVRAALVSGVSHGALQLRSDGGFTYTPASGYVGTDSFRYRPSGLLSTAATVTITVTNAAPVAVPDAYSTPYRTTLVVPAPGVLANDTDTDGD